MDGGGTKNWQWRALLAALALTCAAGWLFKAHCNPGGWTQLEQYTTGCYSDAYVFWGARDVDKGRLPYFEARMEYPVLTGAAIWLEGAVARVMVGPRANASHFLGAVAAANAALAFLILHLFRSAGVDRWRLWGWAAAPPLILYLAHNWDLVAIAFAVAAMLLARRGRREAGAALAALGVAAKLFPALLLPLLGLQALFERDRSWRQRLVRASGVTAAAVGAWSAVNLPVAVFAFDPWSEFYRFSQERGGTAGATWDVLQNNGWLVLAFDQRNLVASLAFLLGAAAIVGLGWLRHRDRLWVLFTPLLAWFLLTNKVWSPQFDLWLWPMLLLTAPRLWPVAVFALGDVAAYFAEFWFFAGMEGGWPATTPREIGWAALLRGFAMLWIIAECLLRDVPRWIEEPLSRPSARPEISGRAALLR